MFGDVGIVFDFFVWMVCFNEVLELDWLYICGGKIVFFIFMVFVFEFFVLKGYWFVDYGGLCLVVELMLLLVCYCLFVMFVCYVSIE